MNIMLRTILAILVLVATQPASASVWSWIDSIKQNSSTNFDYTFTIASWDENDENANPCYELNACTLFISHRHDSSGNSGTGVVRSWDSSQYPAMLTAKTIGALGKVLNSALSLPFNSTTNHNGSVGYEECVGIFYAAGTNLGNNQSSTNQTKFQGYPLLPGSICGTAPQPSGSCDFNQDVLTLDHGTLTRQELDGHEVSESVSINCTTSQTLKLYIYSADNVQLRDDGSLYSELYMNENVLGTSGFTLDVAEQENVVVKSVLHTNGSVAAGEFSGSTVMLITVE